MPLYEGIGLGTEKQAVVLDIGSAYTKCGFVAEAGPRCIIASEVMCQESGRVNKIFPYTNKQDLYNILVEFIYNLYFRHLLVSPKDRRVVIVESLLCPTVFRDTLAEVLFRHFEVLSVLFVPSHLVALCTLGVNTGLVLDVGHQEAVLIPVYEGVPMLHAWQAQPLASQAVERNLRKILSDADEDENSPNTRISDSTIEDIKVRTCFVTNLERSQKMKAGTPEPPPPPVSYQADGSNIVDVPGTAREQAYEVLFDQDGDEVSVSTMVLDAVMKCPVDTRKALSENLLLMGGTAMAMGFKARLMAELKHLLSKPKYAKLAIQVFKIHNPPAKENYAAWLGGSIFGGTDFIVTRSLSKEYYLKINCVPDWSNLLYNSNEECNKMVTL